LYRSYTTMESISGFSQDVQKQPEDLPRIGWPSIAFLTHGCRCEGPLTVQLMICSKCDGVKNTVFPNEFGSLLRTETVSLPAGEVRVIPACKCDQGIFNPFVLTGDSHADLERIGVALQRERGHTGAMGSKANDYQIGGGHYRTRIQHWDYVLANKIPYLEAMVIKYLTRWRKKNGAEDVKKAYHFILKLAEAEGIDLTPPPVDTLKKAAAEVAWPAGQGEVASGSVVGASFTESSQPSDLTIKRGGPYQRD
jgi:Protein of unknwon function (DUF3310)